MVKLLVLALLLLVFAGCESRRERGAQGWSDYGAWYFTQSPQTGKCYEVVDFYYGGGMVEIDCADIPLPKPVDIP